MKAKNNISIGDNIEFVSGNFKGLTGIVTNTEYGKQFNAETKPDGYTLLATEPCANCKETVKECACMRNICHKCQKPVGNITFTICDECWDIEFP